MIVYRIEADEIGPNGAGAAHFATRAEVREAIREYKTWRKENGRSIGEVAITKIVVENRGQLASALDDAMGFGAT